MYTVQVLRLLGGDEAELQDREATEVHRPRDGADDLRDPEDLPQAVQEDQPQGAQVLVQTNTQGGFTGSGSKKS